MASLTTELNVATFPKVLKPILPFLQRANDFEKRAPLVAFYCRTYAAQLGITIIQSGATKEDGPTKMLIDLMDKLETDKQSLDANTEDGRATVELFAIKMFKKADDADRAGRHDAIVARLFYASSVLMEVTKQFGDLSEDIVEKQKYARWKAAEISRAIKTGSSIAPGPYGSDDGGYEQEQESETEMSEAHQNAMQTKQTEYHHTAFDRQPQQQYSYNQPQQDFNSYNDQQSSYDQHSSHMDTQQDSSAFGGPNHQYEQYFQQEQEPSFVEPPPQQSFAMSPQSNIQPSFIQPPPQAFSPPPQQSFAPPPQSYTPPKQALSPPPQQVAPTPKPQPSPAVTKPQPTQVPQQSFQFEKEEIPLEDVMKAQKFTKFAMSSLQFNDIDTARKYLRDALQLIGG
ncbi:Vta1-like protein [Acrasis kona]|uniref:Vta1-like protein n=1 Tax=Acrasis kona TaxID=1008807 RepID=A0AAW2ZPC9_9EUKA